MRVNYLKIGSVKIISHRILEFLNFDLLAIFNMAHITHRDFFAKDIILATKAQRH